MEKINERITKPLIDDYCEFIEDTFSIYSHNKKRNVDMKLSDLQKKLINAIQKENRLLMAKDRQTGISTALAVYLACYLFANDKKRVILHGPSLQLSKDTLGKVRNALYTLLPIEYLRKNSAFQIELPNGSTICTKANLFQTDEAARLGKEPWYADIIVIEEAAWIEDKNVIKDAELILENTPMGDNKLIIVSTFRNDSENDVVFLPLYIKGDKSGFSIL